VSGGPESNRGSEKPPASAPGHNCPGVSRDLAWDDPAWLRGDLYTAERLEEHAIEIARAQGAPSQDVTPGPLRERFTAARDRINHAYRILERGAPTKRELSPAEEWLLDNSHVVEEQLREIEEDLPAGYLAKLPRLSTGVMAGYPCVYGLCLDYLRHTDARLDLALLTRFVLSYQSVRSLTIGELWAIPIMLRLGLLLTVGALAASEANSKDRARADQWAAKLLAPGQRASRMGEILESLEHEGILSTPQFLVQLLRRLREHDGPIGVAIDWVAVQSARLGLSAEELTRRQHLRQAADQVSVGNAITSMRTIGALDWNKFFEQTSVVEAILQRDPAKAYGATDAKSRDRYRHAIEDIARRSTGDEQAIAELTIELAEAAHRRDPDNVGWAHVGYYLIDAGRPALEARFRYRPLLRERVQRFVLRYPTATYLGSVGAMTTGLVVGAVLGAKRGSTVGKGLLAAVGALSIVPASEIALTIVNGLVTALLPPRLLPKLDFPRGVPAEYRTLVAVPALLDSEAGIRRLLADLEIRSLANADENLNFALITDFTDHHAETHDDDERLLTTAREGIAELNRRSAGGRSDRYLLLHRRRLHNPAQGVWMGWERKRGKLEELNRLLRGEGETTFSLVTAPSDLLRSFRYVITLDADTELPRETGRKLVATIAHPLNRPRIDPITGRIVEGYGVIQPRVGTEPVSARRSLFARIMAGPAGIDPYTTAVSDVYQDLFGEGSYVGKAIYDVEAFAHALDGRVPENRMLSHDLFEGIFARTALATDIELIDDQPASYSVVAGRQHRWIRGDWQLLAWLSTHVPVSGEGRRRNDLSAVALWKLFDNLRRSLVSPNLLALLALGWLSNPTVAVVATATLGGVMVTPLFGWVVMGLTRSRRDGSPSRLSTLGGQVRTNLLQAGLKVVFLQDQAMIMVDAIGRTLYRLFVSRQQLLEWTTTSAAERARAKDASDIDRRMLFGSAMAVGAGAVVGLAAPATLPLAAPLLLLWAVAPLVAQRLSRPLPPRDRSSPLSAEDRRELRLCARKTWYFFETFVTAEDNWLPPDNFQEDPRAVVAHRTSPTNIGLYLLSTVAARDFGFVALREVTERLGATLTTIEKLEKREGHILNWYETTTLKPLDPRYVSTVDSGNLAAYLWTVRAACGEAADSPLIGESALDAAIDNLDLLAAEIAGSSGRTPSMTAERVALRTALTAARAAMGKDWGSTFNALVALTAEAEKIGAGVVDPRARAPRFGVGSWGELTRRGLSGWLDEVRSLAPFAESLAEVPEVLSSGGFASPWAEIVQGLSAAWTPTAVIEATRVALTRLVALEESFKGSATTSEAASTFLLELRSRLIHAQDACGALSGELTRLAARAGAVADGMSFKFLYDEERALFSIGYNVGGARLDASYYDLLASEARLASLIAIAKGDLPQEHWFRLSRPRAELSSGSVLLSWSGSMFEYLMPLLVTRTYENTLLDETCDSVVSAQRAYGEKRDVPWGISESAYNTMDLGMTYQYRAFGVPGLGLKAGLAEDLVVAPYATALAALIRPDLAAQNLRALGRDGLEGGFGYYESIDYTPNRVPAGRKGVVVKAFMAHHQGMTLVALDNVLCGSPMQRRFHGDARIKASELLLEERVPVGTPFVELRAAVSAPATSTADSELDVMEHVGLAATGPLRAHLLGHGELSTLVTAVGTGFTTWRGLDIHRFREDPVLDSGGIFLYVRDRSNGDVWSAGFQPTRRKPDQYNTAFSNDRVEIHRRDGDLETVTEIGVSPEHPVEVRRVTVTNHGTTPREIELTTYTEVVLADRNADVAHRAFSGMFVETEALPERGALLARRIPRSSREEETWLMQVLTSEDGSEWGDFEFECSRGRFVGRGSTLALPQALVGDEPLSGTTGAVLDPALSLRRRVLLQPGKRARIAVCTALAPTRDAALELLDIYSAAPSIARSFELGWADARVELKHLGMTGVQAERSQRLLSALFFPVPELRACADAAAVHGSTKEALWSHGISGDLPILLLRVDEPEFVELCRELLLIHEYWRLNGVSVDLVILNEEPSGYNQPLQEAILAQIAQSPAQGQIDQRGGVFVRREEQLSLEARTLVLGAARVVLVASRGSLARQLRSAASAEHPLPAATPDREIINRAELENALPEPLLFGNGLGGFREDGREYLISTAPGARTPAPWCNVIANPSFGCVVSESGSMVTWSGNSQSHRLTPWSNDAVTDPSGETIYLRDDEDGSVWSATPAPAGGDRPYEIRHGQGYTLFRHSRGGLDHELCVFVDAADPVKICRLRLHNRGSSRRTLSVCGTVEWVLGGSRERSRLTVVTAWDHERHALLAFNPFSVFPAHRAFFLATAPVTEYTADREEIFGRSGSRRRPAALDRAAFSGRTGAGLDPGGALLVPTTIEPGETVEISFVLGEGATLEQAQQLCAAYASPARVEASLSAATAAWDRLLGTVTVKTPNADLDLLLNRWLLYQALSSRLWARSAFYQSGGAYGFRDQLQDVLALLHADPGQARAHILRSAERQFVEGDVQHWWHAETGEGVRTRCSDDLLWLPYVTAEYVRATGDTGILEEVLSFLDQRPLKEGEHDVFGAPARSAQSASLYEHCTRALDAGTTAGAHGLPLMRAGDWNDGMNRIGEGGTGESVWLAWFLAKTLRDFTPLALAKGDGARAARCAEEIQRLTAAIEDGGWDGEWYRRAYFDDGTPVGSRESVECKIDAIAQSWAVISGVGDPTRAVRANQRAEELLVRKEDGMMLLFDPPFTGQGNDPGYIRAYPAGVRENGGQYTHGVLWSALATALSGDGDRATEMISMLAPINHASTPEKMRSYVVEPYVVAADVYAAPGNVGRGGWTWYTGSAAWMYRIALGHILGIQLEGGKLRFAPCVPKGWPHYEVQYRRGATTLHIVIENPQGLSRGPCRVELDGQLVPDGLIDLADDGRDHQVRVTLLTGDFLTRKEPTKLTAQLDDEPRSRG
jgi:cyclic beta-1,2-glucan glucanotransferase